MTSRLLAVIVGTALALGFIGHLDRAATQTVTTQQVLMLSAAAKKSDQARRRSVPGQIACRKPITIGMASQPASISLSADPRAAGAAKVRVNFE
jgi:hypothetical protein